MCNREKVQVYSLISSLKTYHPTLHLTPWSLDLFIRVPFQLHGEHTVLQPFRRIELIVHIAISVLSGTHFHKSQVKHLRVKCQYFFNLFFEKLMDITYIFNDLSQ